MATPTFYWKQAAPCKLTHALHFLGMHLNHLLSPGYISLCPKKGAGLLAASIPLKLGYCGGPWVIQEFCLLCRSVMF